VRSCRIASALLLAGLALTATPSYAAGTRFLPVLESGFTLAPTLALTAGVINVPDADGHDADFTYGADFNFNCILFQTPANRMRTHLLVNHSDTSGVQSTTLDVSPRYTLPLGGGFAVGVGPSLAWVMVDAGDDLEHRFGYGATVGPEYRRNRLYTGVDVRYLATTERHGEDFAHWTFLAKVGVNF